jgi:hypothetical protein
VVLGRGGILLGCEQGLEAGLLRGGTTEIEADAAEPGIGGHAAGIILGQRKRMLGTLEGRHCGPGDLGCDAARWRLGAQETGRHRAGNEHGAQAKRLLLEGYKYVLH